MTASLLPPETFPIDEKCSGQCTAVVVGNDGVTPISSAILSTLVLTLYAIKNDGTDAVINGRNAQNVLNANNVTVDTLGNLVWVIQTADTTMVEDIPFERHVALFEWTWPAGVGKREVILVVRNLHRVV